LLPWNDIGGVLLMPDDAVIEFRPLRIRHRCGVCFQAFPDRIEQFCLLGGREAFYLASQIAHIAHGTSIRTVDEGAFCCYDTRHSKPTMKALTTLELCAGGGGQALGLEQAGIEHVALVEFDGHACETLRKNRPKWNVIRTDIREFNASSFRGVDIVSGGLPCPPFSVAGKQLGTKALKMSETKAALSLLFLGNWIEFLQDGLYLNLGKRLAIGVELRQ
jgi:hypothetical protein